MIISQSVLGLARSKYTSVPTLCRNLAPSPSLSISNKFFVNTSDNNNLNNSNSHFGIQYSCVAKETTEIKAKSHKPTLLSQSCNSNCFFRLYSEDRKVHQRETMALSDEDAKKACVPAGPETEGFFFQQTMLRIKDPKRSLDFYTRVMGMTLLLKLDFPEMEFSLYFMGYEKAEDVPSDPKERAKFCFSRKATLELTHNHGTEDKEGQSYHNGNSDPRGFGHIGIVVPDVYKACERFEQQGVNFIKKPDGGKMKGLAFIKDPDDYWIEILNPTNMAK